MARSIGLPGARVNQPSDALGVELNSMPASAAIGTVMDDTRHGFQRTASIEQRVSAVQAALERNQPDAGPALEELDRIAQEQWVPQNGARVVARAWIDRAFRERLLANGRSAVAELGLELPKHHRHLVVLENTPTVHNVICCTLCSCTAFTLIGLPPDWYKDLEYRSRIVRQSRTVLRM